MKYGFGVDLGGTTVKIAYFDQEGTMLHKWEIPTVTANKGKQILPCSHPGLSCRKSNSRFGHYRCWHRCPWPGEPLRHCGLL